MTMTIYDLDNKEKVMRSAKPEEGKEVEVLCLEVLGDNETAIQANREPVEEQGVMRMSKMLDIIGKTAAPMNGDCNILWIWSLRDCRVTEKVTLVSPALSLSASLEGVDLLVGCKDGIVRLWRKEASAPQLLEESGASVPLLNQESRASAPILKEFKEERTKRGSSAPVTAVAWLTSEYFVSGAEDGSVAVWKVATCATIKPPVTEHNSAITSFAIVNEGDEFLSCSKEDPLLKWWSKDSMKVIQALPGALSLAVSRNQFYVTTLSNKTIALRPFYSQHMTEEMRKTIDLDPDRTLPIAFASLREEININELHRCVKNDHSEKLDEYLKVGVPSLYSSASNWDVWDEVGWPPKYGSPLNYAMDKNNDKCRDVILKYLIKLWEDAEKDEDVLVAFYAYREDLPKLLGTGCCLLVPFLKALSRKAAAQIPLDVKCLNSMEEIVLINKPYRSIYEKANLHITKVSEGSLLVQQKRMELYVCPLQIDLRNGSETSLELLDALNDCPIPSVLTTGFASSVIHSKWDHYYPFTLGMTLAYFLMLGCMVALVFHGDSLWLSVPFLIINVLFLLYERIQMASEGIEYLTDPLNYIDLCRGFTSVVWVLRLMTEIEFPQALPLVVFCLCFFRGFTYFRSFPGTRIYVYMTKAVLLETMPFFVILAYTVFSFGILFSILQKKTEEGIWMALAFSYNITLGEFDNGDFSAVEWGFFAVASITNIIVILNLLISILGEAFGKVRETTHEKDLRMQLDLLLEYERMQPVKDSYVIPPYAWLCKSIQNDAEEEDQLEQLDKKVTTMEGKLDKILALLSNSKQ